MATNWYDPSGSNAGFYNSPQDFLFKSQGGTWYGQGAAGQADAGKVPTMGDYYFGAPAQAAPAAQPASAPMMTPSMPQVTSQGTSRTFGSPGPLLASVPQGPLWQRYQALQADPSQIEADPAFQFLREQGEQALSRSAGARRQRFSGGTMLDFMKHGQGLASTYLKGLLPELRAGAGQEYGLAEREAQARAARIQQQDPTGGARNVASSYKTLQELQASPLYSQWARSSAGVNPFIKLWEQGKQYNEQLGF